MSRNVLHLIRRGLAAPPDGDAELLRRFAESRDEAAIVDRHGPMVWAVCRHTVPNRVDAEDVFQATFFALSRSAESVRHPERLAAWLHAAAVRIGSTVKRSHARRVRHERAAARPEADTPVADAAWAEALAAAHAEVAAMPPSLRAAFVLCDLEGVGPADAAARLGVKVNTLSGHLARARRRLLDRLTRRGAGTVVVLLGSAASAPPAVARQAVEAAGGALPSAAVVQLAKEITVTKFVTLKVLAAGVVLAAGLGGLVPTAGGQNPVKVVVEAQPVAPATTFAGWGTVTDPDADCKFTVAKGRLTIGIPGTDHALCVEQNRMNAPRVLQDVDGDFIAQVKVSGDYPAGAKSLVPTRKPFHGAGLLLWADAKNYVRLERAELVADDKNYSYGSFELRKDGEFARVGDANTLPLTEKETYLRLERRGGTVYGSVSADGAKWESLEPIAVELPKKVRVGVVAGHNTSSSFDPAFDEFKLFTEVGRSK